MANFVNELINDERAMGIHLGKNHDDEDVSILHDARGIPVGKTCWRCETFVKLKYRPEIFTDSNYDTYGETIEPDDGYGGGVL